ncbi:MAG: sulfite exporter TauE/SafE family protein [Bacteroidales bacterium]
MEWFEVAAVLLVGFAAGFINTISGSGSLLTLPLLIFLGLPAPVANGTNRVSILFQTSISSFGYHRRKLLNLKKGLSLAVPATLGALAGAVIAADLDEKILKQAIGVLLLCMLVIILIKPERWFKPAGIPQPTRMGPWQWLILFVIGIYGGFIQAGVGFLLLAGLVWGNKLDVVTANVYKNFIVLCFTLVALVVFLWNGQVSFLPGIVLATGSSAGAWLAVKLSIKKGPAFISWFLVIMIIVSAFQLMDVLDLIRQSMR